MKTHTLLLFLAIALTSWTCNNKIQDNTPAAKAKNVILLIGDGMGMPQISSIYHFGDAPPAFNRFKNIGLHENAPSDKKITDSAAGATAISAGVQTYNGAIGVDDKKEAVKTILETAEEKGLKTGVVSTSSVTHATPASFYAHVEQRKMQEEIAVYLAEGGVDFVAGGGYKWFGMRTDGKDYLKVMSDRNYLVDTNQLATSYDINEQYVFLLAPDGMPKMQQGRGDFLPQATQAALDYLGQSKDGFFLVVEGSQIDWGGHANDAEYIIEEMKDFNKAVHIALDYAEKKGNTLVVVTADHETGGFALSGTLVRKQSDYSKITPTFSTGGHTAALIPVFAKGPGAERFRGVYRNTEIYNKMMAGYGWK